MTIDDLDTLKVLADPLRLRIRELMTEPCTVKQVAAELNIPPTQLYYHINLLEKHGLIVLVDTRIVSGIIEKHYQVAARVVRLSRQLLTPSASGGEEALMMTLDSLFSDTRGDLLDSLHAGALTISDDAPTHKGLTFAASRLALTAEQAADFLERMDALIQEFRDLSEAQRDRDDLQTYKSLSMVFPSSRRTRPEEQNKT